MITIVGALLITKLVKLIRKKKIGIAILSPNKMTFIVYITDPSLNSEINLFHRAQFVFLLIDNTLIVIFLKYADFITVFFPEFVAELSEYTEINNHLINLVDG